MSAESRERFDLFFCWCSKNDVDANLVPAGTYQATKLTTKLYYHDVMKLSDISTVNSPSPNARKVLSMRDTECKQIALKKVMFYLKDSEMSNSGNLYPAMEFETIYFDLLKSDNIHHNNHTTTFADLLVKYVPGLNKKTGFKRVSVFFDTVAIGLNTSSETYFDSLIKIIGPVRKAMH